VVVRRFALILALSTGCFYFAPINQRPSIEIVPASSDPVFRGDNVVLHASIDDPEGEESATDVVWHAYLCTDATDQGTCDMATPFYTGATPDANFVVPAVRRDQVAGAVVLVTLDATDPGGAKAKPSQELIIPVNNRPPDLCCDRWPAQLRRRHDRHLRKVRRLRRRPGERDAARLDGRHADGDLDVHAHRSHRPQDRPTPITSRPASGSCQPIHRQRRWRVHVTAISAERHTVIG
jgi:hypothetical protein